MSNGFDNREFKTRYPAGRFSEQGESVFQHRTVPAAEQGSTQTEEEDYTRNQVDRAGSAGADKTIGLRSRRLLRLGSAIGAVLLMVYLGNQAYQVYLLSPEQLYTETFQPYVLRTSKSADTSAARFETYYRQGSMDSIIRAARGKVILSEKETLITGLAYLTADDPFWAIRQLKKIAAPDGTTFAPEADFYLALAYLKNRDFDHALTVILGIRRRPDHPYRDKFPPDFVDRVKLLKWR